MNDAKRAVALLERADDHAKPEDIGELLETYRLAFHFAPDRIRSLLPAAHVRIDAAFCEFADKLLLDFRDQVFVTLRERSEPLSRHLVGFRVELAEGEVLELLAHLMHAHAAREGGVDIEGLLGDAPARLWRHEAEGAHVVQPVGELHQQHAHIGCDGEQQLAQVFRLGRLLGNEIELGELGQTINKPADVWAEQLIDLGASGRGILYGVMQEGCGDRRVIKLQVGQDRCNFQGMSKVGIARGPRLRAMRHHRVDVGAIEQRLVGGGIVAPDPLD